jgi:hypothetical protein
MHHMVKHSETIMQPPPPPVNDVHALTCVTYTPAGAKVHANGAEVYNAMMGDVKIKSGKYMCKYYLAACTCCCHHVCTVCLP